MKKGSKGGGKKRATRDPQKESLFNKLSGILAAAGYTVRREELKRGLGWRATSGSCRALDRRLVFVDRRLSQDEQIAFLQSRIMTLGLEARDDSGTAAESTGRPIRDGQPAGDGSGEAEAPSATAAEEPSAASPTAPPAEASETESDARPPMNLE